MSSVGQVVGGIVGAVIGWFAGGPYGAVQGFMIGAGIGGMLFPPPGPDGPRLTDLGLQGSEYGLPIVDAFGTVPVQGNVIWATDLVERSHEEGGKGSGGGSTVFTYYANFAVGLVNAPPEGIAGIGRIWTMPSKRLIYDARAGSTGQMTWAGSIRLFNGAETQMPSALQESYEGVGNVPAYRGLAYVEFQMYPVEKDYNKIPFLLVEVIMKGTSGIPDPVAFGESESSDMDLDTGYIWTNPEDGHAQLVDGEYNLDNPVGAKQIQVYNPITRELVWFMNTPSVTTGLDPLHLTYPSGGSLACSGGYAFVGSGTAGTSSSEPDSPVGMAINCETKSVAVLMTGCAHDAGYNNSFYWPDVPIPLADNNGIYFAGSNGTSLGFALGFMPSSIIGTGGEPDYDPTPDRTSAIARWVVPAGFGNRRNKNVPCPTGSLDVANFTLPHWAIKSLVVSDPNIVVVQGYESYVTVVTHAPAVDAFSIATPAIHNSVLPSTSDTHMPPLAWDPVNDCGWAFCGTTGDYSLYKITRITTLDAGYTLPSDHRAMGMAFDYRSGCLRVLTRDGTASWSVILFDPIAQVIVEETPISLGPFGSVPTPLGKARFFNMEQYDTLIYANESYMVSIPYSARVTALPTYLSEVVTDLHLDAGLTEDQLDVSALEDIVVDGYQIARQTSVRSAIDALRPVYFFDAVESGTLVKYVLRGGASVATIPDEDLGARLSTDSPGDPLTTMRKMENELPSAVNVKFILAATNYEPDTKYQRRLIGASGEQASLELPMVLTEQKAQEVSDVNTFGPWMERLSYEFNLPRKYAYLEPTDPIVVKGFGMRLTKITDTPHGIRRCEAVAVDNLTYTPDSTTTVTPPIDETISAPARTSVAMMDISLVRDEDSGAGFYAAVCGDGTPWSNATLYKSADAGATYTASTTLSTAATMGFATNAMGAFTQNVFDETNFVNVQLQNGTLSSATELAVLNGANVCALNNEIFQFKTATLEADGTYTLSGLLRGRRGTEWATAHYAGERFVLLTASTVARVPGSTAEIGLARAWKAVTGGATLASTISQGFTNTGAALECYAPVLIGGGRNAAGDITINWVRRTRAGGEWRDNVDVPLGEASELYTVEIWDDAGYTTLVRTISGLTTATVTYTAAQQTTDFGSAQATVYVRVMQVSDIVGTGRPGLATI